MKGLACKAGAALALVVVLIAALSGLGYGALALARRQALAARAGARVLQATLAAEGGLLATPAAWPTAADSLAFGGTLVLEGDLGEVASYRVRLQRLGVELHLAESVGRPASGPVEARSWAALWRLDPLARVAAARAAVVHGGGLAVSDGGRVEASALPAPSAADACAPWMAAIDTLFPGGWLPRDAPVGPPAATAWSPSGDLLPFDPEPLPPERAGLGLLSLDTLLAAAAVVDDALESAEPACDDPGGPGGCVLGNLYRSDAGAASGGVLRGVLVADGNLALQGDASVEGWVLVSGDLALSGTARVTGFVRAGGRVTVSDDARLLGDPCAAILALLNDRLRRPRVLPPGTGLGPPG